MTRESLPKPLRRFVADLQSALDLFTSITEAVDSPDHTNTRFICLPLREGRPGDDLPAGRACLVVIGGQIKVGQIDKKGEGVWELDEVFDKVSFHAWSEELLYQLLPFQVGKKLESGQR